MCLHVAQIVDNCQVKYIRARQNVISGLILIHVSTTAAHCDLVFRQTNGCRYWAWRNGETCADKPCSFDQSNAKWSQCRTVLRLILIQGWSMNFGGQTWKKNKSQLGCWNKSAKSDWRCYTPKEILKIDDIKAELELDFAVCGKYKVK